MKGSADLASPSTITDDAEVPARESYSVMELAVQWRISEDDVWSLVREFDRNVREWQEVMEATSPIPHDFTVIPRQFAETIRPKKQSGSKEPSLTNASR